MMRRSESGFTLVEVGVVVPIIMLLALSLFSAMFSYLLQANREQIKLYQTYDQSAAFDRLEQDVRLSTAFLTAKDTAMSDPYGSDGSGASFNFAGTTAGQRVLIMREFATGDNPLSTVRTPIYQMTSSAPDCSLAQYIVGPLTYNIVYFVSGNTLYKRVLINKSAPTCKPQYEKLSCPPSIALGTNSCGASDEVIATNVTGFDITYYPNQASGSSLDAYNNTSLIGSARTVNLTIQSSQRSYNGSVTTSSSLRASSQNASSGGS